jgi:hypothetical protein
LSGDFWDVRAFFLLLCLAFVGKSGESINGILEATSLGVVQIELPLFCIC